MHDAWPVAAGDPYGLRQPSTTTTETDGATDRSYGIHVADLAGIPEPVVNRSREVLDRLRNEKAIQAKGSGDASRPDETVQAVFDLGGGAFREEGAAADGGATEGRASSEPGSSGGEMDPATESVLAELRETDVNEVTPVDLISRVQEWQGRLDE